MASSRGLRAIGLAGGMALAAVAGALAWQAGMWGAFTLSLLVAAWFAASLYGQAARSSVGATTLAEPASGPAPAETGALLHRLLLDAAPTPLVALHHDHARALNRAARQMFGTDARILPIPGSLADEAATHLHHEGRRWRIDRVRADGDPAVSAVVALVDVESEASLAEARASAELIDVLGHELLNGLAPIVSLADSAQRAADAEPVDHALLREILGPLKRRAEGLERFARAYRELARLPAPTIQPWDMAEFLHDLRQGFVRRWPDIDLVVESGHVTAWRFDRDQLSQALWALLHNAAEAASQGPSARVDLSCHVEGQRLALEVADSGNGIVPGSADHIFRPFHTTKPEGSGIGLSLARQIARAHGGTVELVGARPTRFRLTLT
ncbi:sensor histidine kinase [Erythrobacter donghaensis]|uniref:sensor histidine kinase n=1 Tax=Erythrobacter donghaensis TaxID=267135 RepID=UPI000A386F65|nr:HAMP domain-containing sensor histidine kinase [Erythrobacter donghaensis]